MMGPAASGMWWRRHLHTLNWLVMFVTVAFGVEATQDFVPLLWSEPKQGGGAP
jgi:hypothetical protein